MIDRNARVIPTRREDEARMADRAISEKLRHDYMDALERDDPRADPEPKADAIQVGGHHYKDMGMQPWDVMEAVLTHTEFVGFLKGNIIKYSMRQGKKQDSDDAGKARHYKQKLTELEARNG